MAVYTQEFEPNTDKGCEAVNSCVKKLVQVEIKRTISFLNTQQRGHWEKNNTTGQTMLLLAILYCKYTTK
jgi:hypothetical protein